MKGMALGDESTEERISVMESDTWWVMVARDEANDA